ncbi:putative zinc-binding metallopeptidase [Roseicyclus sp. F158]|uniref:Zinc-binding metallopeptidase n=1 Tax=Tropicimonas omnivorans TaxID=3075590 RepID=A0ABU3DF09_9RHOB|nr:putative zinc-binding metallopeptidase [Roseicyclus sp. F158]MDT0682154.1 putative zinc-binding metallopeptidase [Roseicyclus sp. F158]
MQIFRCPACSAPLYFRNSVCRCGEAVAFDPDAQEMRVGAEFCANRERIGCNWIAEEGDLCRSCAMTEVVPDVREPDNVPLWAQTELSKRWMLANLARWGWFTSSDTGRRPVFRLLSEQTATGQASVIMGHADGTITINVSEASEAVRAERREQLGELYRTMIGHMRHEMAHFLQLRLAEDPDFLEGFRALYGDERADYGEALKRHYADPGAPGEDHITSYATSHPHEDWAETIAHLLHLTDLLDSAAAAGLSLGTGGPPPGYDAYAETSCESLLSYAIPITIAVNHVNRAVNLPDLYPFVLPQGVRDKLSFAHGHLRIAPMV